MYKNLFIIIPVDTKLRSDPETRIRKNDADLPGFGKRTWICPLSTYVSREYYEKRRGLEQNTSPVLLSYSMVRFVPVPRYLAPINKSSTWMTVTKKLDITMRIHTLIGT